MSTYFSKIRVFTDRTLKSEAFTADLPMATTPKTSTCTRPGDYPNATLDKMSRWPKRAGIPHMGGASGLPRTSKGLFTDITQALYIEDTDPEGRKATSARCPSARRA